ncbi:hypothetical protein M569_07197 [Genlisea aurea]|uniref:Uncharacterized protein n=1 Tax=Genlisea aurea TaxID=192259 RepID=S8DWK7_9LAMI|nr:hypothetical protein M569_07197 [Genlisea aurea]
MVPVRSILVVAAMLLTAEAAAGFGEGRLALMLERANHVGMKLSQLKDFDRVRHGRFLAQQSAGVVDFPVQGSFNPFTVGVYAAELIVGF